MDNYYAWLDTHVLADETQLKRALMRRSEAGKLSLEQIRILKQVLFHPQRKSVYDRVLQQAHPELWVEAERMLQAAEAPFETTYATKHAVAGGSWLRRRWVWLLTLLALLLGTWQLFPGDSQEFADLPDINVDPAFVESLSQQGGYPYVASFHPGNGLLLDRRLRVLYNGDPARKPYHLALEQIRQYYKNQPAANQQVLWLAEDRLLLGHDVWQLGAQGATQISRLSLPEPPDELADILRNRLDRFMTAVPMRDYVARAYPIRGIMQLEFAHIRNGQLFSMPDGTLEEANDFDLMVLRPPYLYFSADGRYMLISYAVRDKVWEIKYGSDGRIQELQPLGHINVRTKITKMEQMRGEVILSPSKGVWMGRKTVRTVESDGILRTWSLPSLRLLHSEAIPMKVSEGQFSADGRHLWLKAVSPEGEQTPFYYHYSVTSKKISRLNVPPPKNPPDESLLSHHLGQRHIWLYRPYPDTSLLLSADE